MLLPALPATLPVVEPLPVELPGAWVDPPVELAPAVPEPEAAAALPLELAPAVPSPWPEIVELLQPAHSSSGARRSPALRAITIPLFTPVNCGELARSVILF